MYKKYIKKYKKQNFLNDLRKLLLSFSFAMIYKIYKILVLIKNYLHYLKSNTFEWFFEKYTRLLFIYLFFKISFLIIYDDEKSKA